MAFPFFTCGGLFYWIDRHNYAGWRVQESMWTHRCRLLDPYNIKRAVGTQEECVDKLSYFLKAWEVTPPPTKALVIVRGLFQGFSGFDKVKRAFSDDFEIIDFSWPSLRWDAVKAADALNALLNRRTDLKQIDILAYGYGGLVVRQAVAGENPWRKKLGRTVFLAVPHGGYPWLKKYENNRIFKFCLGQAGQSLIPENAAAIPLMKSEFGIITGGKDAPSGFCPWIKEDNDGLLPASCAKLSGAKEEYIALNKTHFFLHRDAKNIELIRSFITTGRFGRGMRIRKEPTLTNMWDD